jgi:hypothetical protein
MKKRILKLILTTLIVLITAGLLSGNIVAEPTQISEFGRQVAEAFLSEHLGLFMQWERVFDSDLGYYTHFIYRDPITGAEIFADSNSIAISYELYNLDNSGIPIIIMRHAIIDVFEAAFTAHKFVDAQYRKTGLFSNQFYIDTQGQMVKAITPFGSWSSYSGMHYVEWDGAELLLTKQIIGSVMTAFGDWINLLTGERIDNIDIICFFEGMRRMPHLDIPGVPNSPLTLIEPLTELQETITDSINQKLGLTANITVFNSPAPVTSDSIHMTTVITALMMVALIVLVRSIKRNHLPDNGKNWQQK